MADLFIKRRLLTTLTAMYIITDPWLLALYDATIGQAAVRAVMAAETGHSAASEMAPNRLTTADSSITTWTTYARQHRADCAAVRLEHVSRGAVVQVDEASLAS